MQAQPKPVVGAVFGLFFGVVAVALLWQLGVVAPGRLILFGVVAVSAMVGAIALTQRVSLVRKRFVVLVVLSSLMGGVALTGIPEFVSPGSLSGACAVQASSSLSEPTRPQDTSATAPFAAAPKDIVAWSVATDSALTVGTHGFGLRVGGFDLPVLAGVTANDAPLGEPVGTLEVAVLQDEIKQDMGLAITGAYHLYGYVHTSQGDCDAHAYVVVRPDSVVGTPLLVGLWVLTALLVIIMVGLAIAVRRSIHLTEREQAVLPAQTNVSTQTTTSPPERDGPDARLSDTGEMATDDAGGSADAGGRDSDDGQGSAGYQI